MRDGVRSAGWQGNGLLDAIEPVGDLWGGAAGRDWFNALAAQIDQEQELSEPEDKISTASTPAAPTAAVAARASRSATSP